MKLFIESLMIFFGTLLAAALVALGEPAGAEIAIVRAVTSAAASAQQRDPQAGRSRTEWSVTTSAPGMR